MNEDDSQQIAGIMTGLGYRQVADEADADVIFLNTCSVRAKPEQKVRTKLGELRFLKLERPDMIVAVCGCMAQREGERIRSYAPFVDWLIGTACIPELPRLVAESARNRNRLSALHLPRSDADSPAVPVRVEQTPRLKAFVPVMYGCDNFCAYCVVPYTRGKERSRPAADILAEIEKLADGGCKEVMLIGQNVNSYGRGLDERIGFADILRMANQVEGLERIRFITSHPKDLSEDLIRAVVELPKVCEHVHLPLQSGSDCVLRQMNRGYTVQEYMDKLAGLRQAVPGIAVTTDIIVGFPGETEEDFGATLQIVEEARFDEAFMFAFSAMQGTAAASMPNQLPANVKRERLLRLIELQNSISQMRNESQIGRTCEVLIEGTSPKGAGNVTGLTRTNKTVHCRGKPDLVGHTVLVRPTKAFVWGFAAEVVAAAPDSLERNPCRLAS